MTLYIMTESPFTGRLGYKEVFMLVRIRVGRPQVSYCPNAPEVALAFASLLVPSALLAFTLALWNIAADLKWTGRFPVASGVWSHWQVWFCMAALLLAFARLLDRYGASGPSEAVPTAPDQSSFQISIEKFEKESYI